MANPDLIVIGAGHNGLVAATYLAKAGRKLSAGRGVTLEHQHLATGLGEIGGRHEPIVSGADDDDVHAAHRQSFRISCAASLPAAPITPPPGCAPEAPK